MNFPECADILIRRCTMDIPDISGAEMRGIEAELAKTRISLQPPGSGIRPDRSAAAVDLIEFTPIPATSHSLLYDSFHALGQALQTGNLKAVQSAYRALAQVMQSAPLSTTGQPVANDTLAALATATRVLGQAVRSGDLAEAQQAYTSMRQALHVARNAEPEPPEDSRRDKATTAQQAYWLVQQDMQQDAGLDDMPRTPGRLDGDDYSIHLLAATPLPHRAGRKEDAGSGMSSPRARSSRILWWLGLNLAALFCCVVTGLLPSSPASAIPMLFIFLVLNGLAWMANRLTR
jgi:hypothetical protein